MFLTATELNTHLYPEIQQAIVRNQTLLVDLHINEALGYIRSRLAIKYDILSEFLKTGSDRNTLLLKIAKDISVYYLYDLPETMPEKRIRAYEEAVKWLDQLVTGKAILEGVLPAIVTPDTLANSGNISHGSQTKRNNTL